MQDNSLNNTECMNINVVFNKGEFVNVLWRMPVDKILSDTFSKLFRMPSVINQFIPNKIDSSNHLEVKTLNLRPQRQSNKNRNDGFRRIEPFLVNELEIEKSYIEIKDCPTDETEFGIEMVADAQESSDPSEESIEDNIEELVEDNIEESVEDNIESHSQ